MPCPLFVDGPRCQCLAVIGRQVPTHHERELYCKPAEPRCPTRRAYVERGVRLTEEEYLTLWLPPRRPTVPVEPAV